MISPRIVHVIAPENLGGAESVVRRFAEMAYREGRDITVVAIVPDDIQSPFVDILHNQGIPVVQIRCARKHYIAEIHALAEVINSIKPEIIHTHLYLADVIGYFAAMKCGLPIVATVHGFTGSGIKSGLYVWIDKQFLKRFDAVVCVSKGVKKILRQSGCREDKLHLIKNCFDAPVLEPASKVRSELGLPSDKHCIGWVGRMSLEKGADLFIESIARINRDDVIGVLIGDGPERAKLEMMVNSLGISRRVKFLGLLKDASRLFPAFDVFVLSSRMDANPMVIFEAVWARVPIITFRVGDVEDMLDESMATFVAPGDVHGLAESVKIIIDNNEMYQKRSISALNIMRDRFSASRRLNEKYALYNQVLEQRTTKS